MAVIANPSSRVLAPTRHVRVAIIAVIVCGMAFALLQRGLLVAVGDRSSNLGALVRFDAGLWLMWFVLSPLVVVAARRWSFHDSVSRSVFAHLLSAIALSLIHTIAFSALQRNWIDDGSSRSLAQVTTSLLTWRLAIDAFVYAAILAIIVALDTSARARAQETAATRAAEESARARLNALQMQIQPHFLFNTLNTAAMLARGGDGTAAADVITQLSSLLRELVADAPEARVSLRAELAFVERYLAIERVRFGERLRVTIDATPESLDVVVPRLLLQPIVENAVRHGLSRSPTSGEISIAAETTSDEWLTVSVADDGPGPPLTTEGVVEGIGLRNTRSRLAALYGDAFELGLSGAPGRVVATLRLPISPAPA